MLQESLDQTQLQEPVLYSGSCVVSRGRRVAVEFSSSTLQSAFPKRRLSPTNDA